MNYLQSIAYIESLAPTLLNPSLERMALFMAESGQLQDSVPAIHVGGTNGKGSTVSMLDSVLRLAGLSVGRFTGPHLLRWNERFHVNGKPIGDADFAHLATDLRELSEQFERRHRQFGRLSWFEFLTAMAFFLFAREAVDIAVVEVGLGGRWDATNVLTRPLCVAITTVELDHTHILGSTVQEIAREKSGIIKAGVPVVTAAYGEALAEIELRASAVGAQVVRCLPLPAVSDSLAGDKDAFNESCVRLSLAGAHQRLNARVARATLACCQPALPPGVESAFSEGLSHVYWPGRLQYLPGSNLVLDGAHNVSGAKALRQALDTLFPGRRRIFVMGFFQNKDVPGVLAELIGQDDRVFVSEAATSRPVYASSDVVALLSGQEIQAIPCNSIQAALNCALAERRSDDLVIAAGSFATVKEVMLGLGWQCVEDGISGTFSNWDGTCSTASSHS